jgi:hypothetical protein
VSDASITASAQTYGDSAQYATYASVTDFATTSAITVQKSAQSSTSKVLCQTMTPIAYLQYAISPATGYSLQVTSVSMKLGGGGTGNARAAIYYSLNDPTFASPVALADSTKHLLAGSTKDNVYPFVSGTDPVSSIALTVPNGQTFYLRVYEWITAWGSSGKYLESANVIIGGTTTHVTSVAQTENALPKTFAVNQNYPNPFNPSTMISYGIPQESNVTVKVFNVLGQEVATLFAGHQIAGTHSVTFDASKLSSGVYLYRVEAGNSVATKKMVLMK